MSIQDKNHSFLKSYIKGEFFLGAGGFITNIFILVNAFLLISNLDVFKYGTYLLILAFYSLVLDFFSTPLSDIIFNDISRFTSMGKEGEAKKLYLENFYIRIFLAVLAFLSLFFGASLVADYYGEDIASLLRILSFLFLISPFYLLMRMLFKVRLMFGTISLRPAIYQAFKLVFFIIFILFFKLGIREAILSHIAATFFATIIFVPLFVRAYSPWKKIKSASGKILLRIIKSHGKWSMFSQVFSRSIGNIKPWLIKFFVNTEGVAIYSVAESLFSAVKVFFPDYTLPALIPRVLGDKNKSADVLLRGTKYLFIYGFLLGSFSFIFLPPIIRIVFPQYFESIKIFQLLLVLLPILSFRIMSSNFLVALRRQKFLFFFNIITVFTTFILTIFLLYLFGLWGIALERIIMTIFIGIVMYIYLFRKEYRQSHLKKLFWFNKEDKIFIKNLWKQFLKYLKNKLSFIL